MPTAKRLLSVHGREVDLASAKPSQLAAWKRACLAAFPATEYDVIYADPPWRYGFMSAETTRLNGAAPYPTMSIEELEALPVRALRSKTCALFLWATWPQLDDALRLMTAWGFEYKTAYRVWVKTTKDGEALRHGTGSWTRSCSEVVLLGTRGSGHMALKTTCSESQVLFAPSRSAKHSAKPPEMRASIEAFLDVPRRLELFARETCPKWDAWGLEVPGFFARAAGPPATLKPRRRGAGPSR